MAPCGALAAAAQKCITRVCHERHARAQDLTESSALGAVLSLISIAIIAALFVAQLKSAFAGTAPADAAR